MRYETRTVRIGENVGPVDWEHPTARDMPPIWREAEKCPSAFALRTDFADRAIFAICMYDGWPYWKPTPAILHASPLGGSEWSFFNSYGVRPSSIVPAQVGTHPQGGDAKQAPGDSLSDAVPEGDAPCSLRNPPIPTTKTAEDHSESKR